MSSLCFSTPSLPFTNSGIKPPSLNRTGRIHPTSSLRFPNGNRNPFGRSSRGNGFGKFFGFSPRNGGFGSNYGSGRDGSGGRGSGRSGDGGAGSESSGNENIFIKLWNLYCSCLDRSPITTKAVTSLIGFFLGDVIAQKFLGDKDTNIDWARVGRMASFGFLLHGPTGHYFYAALDRLIVGTTPLKVASKVAIDQVLWAPIFTAMFFSYLGFTEGKSIDDVITKIKNDTWMGVTTSWKFWPLAHTINFAFVPTAQRLLYVNSLQVGYNVILSIIGNK